MPPHMHPRSRMTSSIFATTVAASFLVVALPHALPCPRTVTYADSPSLPPPPPPQSISPSAPVTDYIYTDDQGRRHRRRRKDDNSLSLSQSLAKTPTTRQVSQGMVQFVPTEGNVARQGKERECPVPKPGGLLGELLGFGKEKRRAPAQGELGDAHRTQEGANLPEDKVKE